MSNLAWPDQICIIAFTSGKPIVQLNSPKRHNSRAATISFSHQNDFIDIRLGDVDCPDWLINSHLICSSRRIQITDNCALDASDGDSSARNHSTLWPEIDEPAYCHTTTHDTSLPSLRCRCANLRPILVTVTTTKQQIAGVICPNGVVLLLASLSFGIRLLMVNVVFSSSFVSSPISLNVLYQQSSTPSIFWC